MLVPEARTCSLKQNQNYKVDNCYNHKTSTGLQIVAQVKETCIHVFRGES